MNFDEMIREEARLILLKTLGEEVNETLNSELLRRALEVFGIARTREWVHEELSYLKQMGAIQLNAIGTVMIASLTDKGRDHLSRTIAITGIKKPSRSGG